MGNRDKIRATCHCFGARFCLYCPFPSLAATIHFATTLLIYSLSYTKTHLIASKIAAIIIVNQFSQPEVLLQTRARTNFTAALPAEGAPSYEQR